MEFSLSFEEYLQRSNLAQDVDELVEVFLSAVQQHGLDKMIFCLMTDHETIGLSAGVGHIKNYPQDWMQYYFENEYEKIDPVITYAYKNLGTFTWDEMQQNLDLTRKQKKCLNLGVDAGLHNGLCTPLWGPYRFAGIGLASSEKKDSYDGNNDIITAYCNHFYLAFHRLHKKKLAADNTSATEKTPNIFLTKKEKEILLWISQGKSYPDISDIINVSESAVKFHMSNIYRKLDCNDKVVAVVKAIALGLISRNRDI